MKPFKIFLYFTIIVVILSSIPYLLKLDYFSGKNSNKIASINNLPQSSRPDTTYWDTTFNENNFSNTDSTLSSATKSGKADTLPSTLIYTNNLCYDSYFSQELQHRLLEAYYKPIHILYFGDSQIEGDRISGTLRHILQSKFGGQGTGFIRIENLFNFSEGYTTTISSGWKKNYIYDHSAYGPFSPLGFSATPFVNEASVCINRIGPNKKVRFSKIGIYYSTERSIIVTSNEASFSKKVTLSASKTPIVHFIPINENHNSVKISFPANKTLKIYGLLIQNGKGVYVDNISMRGQIYPFLQRVRPSDLSNFIKEQNVGLIILHYGVNLVPCMLSSYNFYTRILKKQIQYIRKSDAKIPILIIGVSDMAHRNGMGLSSYTNIPAVESAQRNAAKQKGVAFWSLRKSMGGKGSIIKWVESVPTLATKDYIHVNHRGADSIGRMLSKTIFIPLIKEK